MSLVSRLRIAEVELICQLNLMNFDRGHNVSFHVGMYNTPNQSVAQLSTGSVDSGRMSTH